VGALVIVCEFCAGDGVVVANLRTQIRREFLDERGKRTSFPSRATSSRVVEHYLVEEYGPCQACPAGKRLEFPPEGVRPVWPDGGFWRGRAMDTEPTHFVGTPPAEVRERVAELRKVVEDAHTMNVLLGPARKQA
jgi:hypothetical protein